MRICGDNLLKYGRAITMSFLSAVLTSLWYHPFVQKFVHAFLNQTMRLAVFIQNTCQFTNFMLKCNKIRAQTERSK